MAGKRTIITLSDKDKAWLEGYSKAMEISMAEAVRSALMLLREAQGQTTYQTLVSQTTGTWEKGDGLRYQEKLRSEWHANADETS